MLRRVTNHRLNPKALSAGQLYGEFNGLSGEWTDGLVPHLVRKCVETVESGTKTYDSRDAHVSSDERWTDYYAGRPAGG